MNIKSCVRRGIVSESISYEEVIHYQTSDTSNQPILAIVEGKGRRKLRLTHKRILYENYFEGSFVGLEDLLLGVSRTGVIGVYPGTHYILWDSEDFLNAIRLNPPLMWRAIDSLSKRIRVYDEKQRYISQELQSYDPSVAKQKNEDVAPHLVKGLYELSFSEEDQFPDDLLDKLSFSFKKNEYVIKQGDTTRDLYIILSGQANIMQKVEGKSEKIDTVSHGDFIGEMSMFDGLPRSADVIAMSDLLVLKFDPINFHLLFQLHSRWSMDILMNLAKRVEQRRKELETFPIEMLYHVWTPQIDDEKYE